MNILYIIHGNTLATVEIADSFAVDSIAYFCSTCGDVWGRIVAGSAWHIQQVPCEQHRPRGVFDWSTISGSILNGMEQKVFVGRWAWAATLDVMPKEVLLRELEVHINYIERKYHEEASEVLRNCAA